MRSSFASLVGFAATAMAHYNFEAIIVNGNTTDPYEYVRQTTNANSPITDVTSKDIICNQGGLDKDIMAKTKTHAVKGGDEVGFTVNSELGHPGPLAVYMSKAPEGTAAQEYQGDGDWFKVYELTTSDITEEGLQWASFPGSKGIQNFTFGLPEELPAGEYLMRAEHVGLHGAGEKEGAQFYIGCAQLSVEGSGAGTPGPTVQFPGAYTGEEPGLLINIYYPAPTSYTAPGPVTWPNKCEDHTANLAGQERDGDCNGDDGAKAPAASSPAAESSAPAATSAAPAVSSPAAAATTAITPEAAAPTAAAAETPAAKPSTCAQKRAARKAKRATIKATRNEA